ncbi:hypothetical protein KDH_25620 [Dictyobacter sp. S3.2.2.5]|uniref:Major facilitator superfamily (MFS) profile domain-containing protein n=1 Tax=Dictyobacter halimunensis TaxID=3026934 RepID=A0ABQ6FQ64_9CHLR|nr:hypothetical protein KDH_25620 [Dictyobacter sp. S3.2.2.5]
MLANFAQYPNVYVYVASNAYLVSSEPLDGTGGQGQLCERMSKMSQKKPSTGKTVAWMYGVVASFVTVYVVGGILLDKLWRK